MGYKKISAILRKEGIKVNKKFVQRVRRDACLQVAMRKPNTRRSGLSTGLPTKANHKNHVWCWDFMFDKTQRGGGIKIFSIIDEWTGECYAIHVDRALKSDDVKRVLAEAIGEHGSPEFIRSDNGSEFIAKPLQEFLKEMEIKSMYIEPGSPWQNGFAESFNSKFRAEFLERELIYTLIEARVLAEDWRIFYNEVRPHRSLKMLTPSEFAEQEKSISKPARATPRGGDKDVFDRYDIIDIYKKPYINLINDSNILLSHKLV
jgi:integrase, catalytic region